ncbi:hypothetical protein, partial [Shewanella sp. SG41-4]|uniref:hypothetical protein n=1 Tax=Shewanella sp. SG41-4 TaxID=2760976 RepID=UPI001C729191
YYRVERFVIHGLVLAHRCKPINIECKQNKLTQQSITKKPIGFTLSALLYLQNLRTCLCRIHRFRISL